MALNKSQAEAVNFGNAVATKAYEKKAGLVDTFVRTETAEQKLAKSGKMQTAQALEALASLGGTALKGKAMQMEQKAQRQQAALATTTAQAIEDLQEGRIQSLTESEDYADLPVYLQIQLAQDVGKQEATKAFQQIQLEYDAAGTLHSDDAAYTALRNGQFTSTDAEDGISIHRQMARNNALEGFLGKLDVQNNKYKSAENLDKLGRAFGNSINDMVVAGAASTGSEIWSNVVELDKQLAATSGLTNGQRKKIISERVMALAISTDSLELLNPDNIPDLFQDPMTLNKFADTKQRLENKVKSDLITENQLISAERTNKKYKAQDDAHSGALDAKVNEVGFDKLSMFEQEAYLTHRNKAIVDDKVSAANYNNTKELIELSAIADSEFLMDKNGNVINDIAGDPVKMNPESLTAYLQSKGDINSNATTTLMGELDTIMQLRGLEEKFKPVGNEISSLISEKIEMGSVYPDRTKTKVLREARRFYRRKMAELLTANEGKELSFDQKDELQDLTEEYAEGQLVKYNFKGDKKEGSEGEVSLDGTVKTSTDTPESDVTLSQEDLDIYNKHVKGKPKEEAKWLAAGKTIPESTDGVDAIEGYEATRGVMSPVDLAGNKGRIYEFEAKYPTRPTRDQFGKGLHNTKAYNAALEEYDDIQELKDEVAYNEQIGLLPYYERTLKRLTDNPKFNEAGMRIIGSTMRGENQDVIEAITQELH